MDLCWRFNIKLETQVNRKPLYGVLYFPQPSNCTLSSSQKRKKERGKGKNLPFDATCVFFFFHQPSVRVAPLSWWTWRKKKGRKKCHESESFDRWEGTFSPTFTVANRIKSNGKWSIQGARTIRESLLSLSSVAYRARNASRRETPRPQQIDIVPTMANKLFFTVLFLVQRVQRCWEPFTAHRFPCRIVAFVKTGIHVQ